MFLLKCPNCKHNMKYQGRDVILVKKRKKCVYCGFSMSVKDSIVKKIK